MPEDILNAGRARRRPLLIFYRLVLLVISLAVSVLSPPSVRALTVTPATLAFDTRLDEPLLLTLDVSLNAPAATLAVDIQGFHCDRRITALGDGKYRVEIAPDTMYAGFLSGDVILTASGSNETATVPVSGRVNPWITIYPPRLFLDSIGKGSTFSAQETHIVTIASDNQPFDILSVDFGDIAGGGWEADPKPGVPASKRIVKLKFSADQLASGIPYGALAKKAIIIHTSDPHASDLIIPVLGLISINTTGRDYSQYLYNGHLRWSGPWSTPNLAALFLSTALFLLCGLAGSVHKALFHCPRWQIALAILVIPLIAIAGHLLAETYSRGGWIGAVIGTTILLIPRTQTRIYAITVAAAFAISIALQPQGTSRVASTADLTGDKSVEHRLLVWQGALQIMAEHPWTGVGPGKFGEVFKTDYQLSTHTDDYTTAVNDYLTFGAERGVPLLVLVLTAVFGLAITALRAGYADRSNILLGGAGAMISFLVCCWFSSVAFWRDSLLLYALTAVVVLAALILREFKQGHTPLAQRVRRNGLTLLSLAASLVISCLIAEAIAMRSRPTVREIQLSGTSGLDVKPRWFTASRTILYLGDEGETPNSLLKSTLFPLAAKGWEVICLDQPKFTSDAYQSLLLAIGTARRSSLLHDNWQLAGHRRGAQLAICLAAKTHPSAIACYLTPAQSAFAELSPLVQIKNASSPLLLSAQDADVLHSAQSLHALINAESRSAPEFVSSDIQRGDFASKSPRWQQWIGEIGSNRP